MRLLNFFCTSKYLVLFDVIFLLKLVSLLSKSVLLTKLAYFNLAIKFPTVRNFIFNFTNFCINNRYSH